MERKSPISWDEYKAKLPNRARDIYIKAEAVRSGRAIRRRPRSPEEDRLLTRQCFELWNNALRSGVLEKLGPRHYRVNVERS